MDKSSRRRECFARISLLTDSERARYSDVICDQIAGQPLFQSAHTIFSFAALRSEPNLQKLFIGHPQKRWAFPLVNGSNELTFHLVSISDELRCGRHGIAEPDPIRHELVPLASSDLVIVPGVSFDPESKVRLGRGKGHYDRYLAGTRIKFMPGSRPVLLGVCFSTQLSHLVPEPHDIPMDHIQT